MEPEAEDCSYAPRQAGTTDRQVQGSQGPAWRFPCVKWPLPGALHGLQAVRRLPPRLARGNAIGPRQGIPLPRSHS